MGDLYFQWVTKVLDWLHGLELGMPSRGTGGNMKRTICSVLALCVTAAPAFCGVVISPEPKSSSWMSLVALAGVGAFAFFKTKKAKN